MELFLLLLSSTHIPNDYMFWQWFIGLTILSFPICILVQKKTSILFSVLFSYNCVWTLACVFIQCSFIPKFKTEIVIFSAMQHIQVLIVIISLLLVSHARLLKIKNALPFYGVINSVYVIGNYLFQNRLTNSMGYQGFLDYSGMNAVLIAICLVTTLFKE